MSTEPMLSSALLSATKDVEGPVQYKVYARRWVVLSTFALLSLMVAVLWISFAPIAKETSKYLDDIGHTAVNMLAICFMILYPFGTYCGSYCMAKYGLRATVLAGGVLTVISAVIRYIAILAFENGAYSAGVAYGILFFGQCFAGLAQPFFMNLPTSIADNWFSAKERDIATTVGSLFNPLGNAVGQLLPTMFVYEQDDGDVQGLPTLLFYEVIMCVLAFGATLIWFQNAPPTPPSRSTAHKEANALVKGSAMDVLKNDVMALTSDRNYMILFFAFSMGLGLFNAIMTLIEQLIDPFGYSSDDAGIFGALLIVCGLVGAAITGVMLDKTHAYRPVLKNGFGVAFCSVILLVFMLHSNNFAGLAVAFSAMGACVLPLLPATLENCAECTYPVSEDLSTGILFAGGNIVGMPITFIYEALIGKNKNWGAAAPANLFILLVVGISCCALYFFEGDYKRLQAELTHATHGDETNDSEFGDASTDGASREFVFDANDDPSRYANPYTETDRRSDGHSSASNTTTSSYRMDSDALPLRTSVPDRSSGGEVVDV